MPKPTPQKGGGGRGGGGHASRKVTISKALSYILRHAAEREGLKMNSQGYANVADVLAWRKLKSLQATFPEILDAVETSDKKRFALLYLPSAPKPTTPSGETETEIEPEPESTTDGESTATSTTATALAASISDKDPTHYLIRATQGHSIKSVEAEALLEKLSLDNPASLPDTVVHGTYHATWPQILASGGLRCMGRNHAHFATGPSLESVLAGTATATATVTNAATNTDATSKKEEPGVISGMRRDAQVLIYIDLRKALEAGCPFWRSENGVILSEGMVLHGGEGDDESLPKVIPVDCFDVVVERSRGLGKIWEKGWEIQTLPEELTRRGNPKGRGRRGKVESTHSHTHY